MAFPIHTNTLQTKPNPDQIYLDGIRQNDRRILNSIYELFLPSIEKFVKSNNGTVDQAHDVFQDGLLVIYKKIKKEELEITTNFHSYLFAVCRFIWLRELTKKNRKNILLDEKETFIADVDVEQDIFRLEKQNFFRSKLEQLPSDSKKVLKMFFNKKSMREIAAEMGYTVEYAKKKKYKAQLALVEAVKRDSRFGEFV